VNNASSLINEIKSFMEKIGSIRQNAEVVDEDFKDLNFSFTETKNSFLVNKDTDKRDSKTLVMDEDSIKIIEEPPPSATRKLGFKRKCGNKPSPDYIVLFFFMFRPLQEVRRLLKNDHFPFRKNTRFYF
jgi:hypothetical protein